MRGALGPDAVDALVEEEAGGEGLALSRGWDAAAAGEVMVELTDHRGDGRALVSNQELVIREDKRAA